MKIRYNIIFFAAFMCLMASCKKETLLDGRTSIERSNALEKELKTQLTNSKDGWIMFVTTLNRNVQTATPVIMKFDTITSKVSMTSMYGLSSAPGYFNISASTGMPLLSFSTGSVLSTIYEIGDANITDYFFKVLKVGPDTITLQSYRKGTASASEGGTIFKMVKNTNPTWIKDWQQETSKLFAQTRFFGKHLTAEMTHASGTTSKSVIAFRNQSARNITFFKENYPTVINNGEVDAFTYTYFPNYPNGTGRLEPLAFMGYNSIFFEIKTGYAPESMFHTGPDTLQDLFKTNYFFIRKINATSIDVFAIDQYGKEVVTGKISY